MRKIILTAIMISLFTLGMGIFGQCSGAVDGAKVKAGDVAPDFEVEMVSGEKVNLSDLKGNVVVLNFWATWCPPCRAELANVEEKLINRFAEEDFIFLPISRGEDKETVMKFREKNNYTFAMGLDPKTEIYNLYAENGVPRNFIIDRDGTVVFEEAGYSEQIFEELIDKVESTLNSK